MASSLSNLINNLSKGIQKVKCKYGHDEKTNVKLAELNINIAPSFLNTQTLKMIWQNTNAYVVTKIIKKTKLQERFCNTYKFSNHDSNKFILLLRKGIYPYEYMDD